MTEVTSIAPLTKVVLTMATEPGDAQSSAGVAGIDFTFVCGLGIEGLTDFELALLGKTPGDRISIPVGIIPVAAQFEHLQTPFLNAVKTPPPFELHIEVKSVAPVSDRELVHALSQKTEQSGCDCGGGCGCGG